MSFSEPQIIIQKILDFWMYILFVIFGILGNVLILKITIFKWKIQTGFNLFITCVAICDIIYSSICVLRITMYKFDDSHTWDYGLFLCQLDYFLCYIGPLIVILPLLAAPFVLLFKNEIKPSAIAIGVVLFLSALFSLIKVPDLKIESVHGEDGIEKYCMYQSYSVILAHSDPFITFVTPLICLIIFKIVSFLTKRSFAYCNLILFMIFVNDIIFGFNSIIYHYIVLNHLSVEGVLDLRLQNIDNFLFITFFTYKIFLYYFFHEGFQKEIKNKFKRNNNVQDDSQFLI